MEILELVIKIILGMFWVYYLFKIGKDHLWLKKEPSRCDVFMATMLTVILF